MTAVLETATPAPAPAPAKRVKRNQAEPAATVAPEQVQEAPESPQADSRYPAESVAQSIATRLLAAREAGWSRTQLSELVEGEGGNMKGAALWRSEQGRVHVDEVEYLTRVLDQIELGAVAPPKRPSKAHAHVDTLRVAQALGLIEAAGDVKRLADYKQLLQDIHEVLTTAPAPDGAQLTQ